MGQKKQAGAELKKKKRIFYPKNWPIFKKERKKRDISGQENKLGLSLRKKKGFFGSKTGENLGNKVQKLNNFKENKDFSGQFFGQKKQAGADLKKRKKIFLDQKLGIMSRN